MSIDSGVQKTMNSVMNEINKAQSMQTNAISRKEVIKKNIGKIFLVPTNEILTSENIRTIMNTESNEFLKLVESIKNHGVIQSIVIEFRDKEGDQYDLVCVAGHRRLAASKKLGIEKIPCLVQQYTNCSDRTSMALAENLIREGLHSLDIAECYAELKASGLSEDSIAKHFERDPRTIQRYLIVSRWPDDIKKIIKDNPEKFPHSVIIKKLAVRKYVTEDEIEKLRLQVLSIVLGNTANNSLSSKHIGNSEVINEFSKKFGLKAEFKINNNKGKFSISFTNEEQKNKLLKLIENL